MDLTVRLLVSVVAVLSAAVLAYKGAVRHDWAVIGSILPRIYLIVAAFANLINPDVNYFYIHLGVAAMFIGDIVSNLAIVINPRFKLEKYVSTLIESLTNLKTKYDFIVENAPIGIFVIDENGKFEFCNKELGKLLDTDIEHLVQKSYIYDFVPIINRGKAEQMIEERLHTDKEEDSYETLLIDRLGNYINAKITAKRTVNGHSTITGTIIKI